MSSPPLTNLSITLSYVVDFSYFNWGYITVPFDSNNSLFSFKRLRIHVIRYTSPKFYVCLQEAMRKGILYVELSGGELKPGLNH